MPSGGGKAVLKKCRGMPPTRSGPVGQELIQASPGKNNCLVKRCRHNTCSEIHHPLPHGATANPAVTGTAYLIEARLLVVTVEAGMWPSKKGYVDMRFANIL